MANNIIDSFLILFTTQVRGNGIQQLNKQTAGVMKNMSGAGNMLKMFFGYDLYTTVRQLIPSLVDASKQMGAMESRFYAITNSSKLAGEELEWVKGQADRLGLEFLKTADSYSIFYSSVAKTMGGGAAREIFQNWAEAFRVLHIDPAKQERVLYALREMSSKGKIYLQDLSNQLGSHIPAAMQIAAKSMGYVGKDAVQRFRKDITAGTVDVQKFLIVFSNAMNGAYVSSEKLANAMEKPDAQLGRLAGRWQRFLIAVSKGGFEKDLVKTLKGVNTLLDGLEKHGPKIYETLKLIAGALLIFGAGKLTVGILKTYSVVAKFIKGLPLLVTGLTRTTMLTRSLIKLIGTPALRLLLGLVSGPVGWTIGIIALLAFILHKFFPNVERSLLAMVDIVFYTIRDYWWMLEDWFKNSTMGKFVSLMAKNKATQIKETGTMTEEGSFMKNMFPNRESLWKVGDMVGIAKFLNPTISSALGAIKTGSNIASQVTTKLNVTMKFESKGEIPEDQMKSLKDNSGNIVSQLKDVIISSKLFGGQPKYTGTRPSASIFG